MSKLEVDAIEPQSGTTLTIGASGDSVNIASGATITDFTSTGIDDNATSTAITIDSSNRVGIGTASPTAKLEINAGDTFQQMKIRRGTGGTDAGIITFEQGDGTAVGHVGGVGSGGLQIRTGSGTGTERMRINSSGNVGIGTSSPTIPSATGGSTGLHLHNSATDGASVIHLTNGDTGTGTTDGAVLEVWEDDNVYLWNYENTETIFATNNSEAMRIDSNGRVGIGTTSPSHGLHVVDNRAGNYASKIENNQSNGFITQMLLSAAPDNNSSAFLVCADPANRCIIWSDGDLDNHDNSYGSLSDERIKQDIRDSNSQWNDIKNIRVRNFKKKDDVRQYGENAWEQIGVISQELETVSPKLIKHVDPTPSDILSDSSFGTLYQEGDEIPEGKNVGDVKEVHDQVKKVSYSVLYMKAIKALQEAMERIETLEAKVQTLENNQP
jgi:hypothetical protein